MVEHNLIWHHVLHGIKTKIHSSNLDVHNMAYLKSQLAKEKRKEKKGKWHNSTSGC
jgi:hypothetical protein